MRPRGFVLGTTALIYGGIAAGVLFLSMGAVTWIQTSRLETCQTEFAGFKATVKAAGDAAIKEKARVEAETKALKEKTDAEIKIALADNKSLAGQLHDDRARSRALSKPAPRAPSPARACFRGPIIDAAVARLVEDASASHGQLDAELSAIVGEGEAARIGLDGAKRWAQAPPR